MKTRLILWSVVVTFGLGGICLWQSRQLTQRKTEIGSLRGQIEEKDDQVSQLQNSRQRLLAERRELLTQAPTASSAPPSAFLPGMQPPPSDSGDRTNSGAEKGIFGKFLAKMMDDPEAKQFLRDQQRVMMDQLYAPLVKRLGLSPEQAGQLKSLLVDNAMKATERATSFLGGASGGTSRKEAFADIAAEQKEFDHQVKTLLGDEPFAQYKDYQQTLAERMQLNLLQQQLANTDRSLSEQQAEQLLTYMKEEKQNTLTAAFSFPGNAAEPAGPPGSISDEQAERLLQGQEETNRKVYERAREVLSTEQLESFARFQTNQLQTMRLGMTMARKFLVPDRSEADAMPSLPPQ
jgi:hypothetical protein